MICFTCSGVTGLPSMSQMTYGMRRRITVQSRSASRAATIALGFEIGVDRVTTHRIVACGSLGVVDCSRFRTDSPAPPMAAAVTSPGEGVWPVDGCRGS